MKLFIFSLLLLFSLLELILVEEKAQAGDTIQKYDSWLEYQSTQITYLTNEIMSGYALASQYRQIISQTKQELEVLNGNYQTLRQKYNRLLSKPPEVVYVEVEIEKLIRLPYEIDGDIDRLSSYQLIRQLEWLRYTHEYAIDMLKSGQWKEGSDGIGYIEDQEAFIASYDKMIATVKWMVNELYPKVQSP